jgi:phage terminase large subunit-like protein
LSNFLYVEKLLRYCHAAIEDTLPHRKTCRLEKLACQRHLNDLAKQNDPEFLYYFDEDAANKRCFFIECLQHTKGKWRGTFISLEPEQIFAEAVKFGWLKKENGKRRFAKSYECIPRKNGKSIKSATTGLYMAFADNEPSAEVYAGATSEKQAMMVFQPAYQMVILNTDFAEWYNIKLSGTPKNPTSIYNEDDMSLFCPIVGNPGDGQSPHCALIDEYHEHPTSVLYDAMDTGTGAREQPLLAVITTAGVNTSYPCYDLHLYAIKILEGTIKDDRFFAMIFTIDKDDKWEDFESWKKANPNYGVSIEKDYLWGKYQDALNKPEQRNVLLTKHLNLWQNAGIGFMDMLRWDKCTDRDLEIENFIGQDCWLSLDLASKIDLAALVFLFRYKRKVINLTCPKCFGEVVIKNEHNVCISGKTIESSKEGEMKVCDWIKPVNRDCVVGFANHYIPEEQVNKKENAHYQKWREQGHLIVTEGARTDFQLIEDNIKQATKYFNVKELVFDPKEASYLIQNIEKWSSFECIEFEQGPANISQPMKELEAMVVACEFWHTEDPVYTWCMGNVIKKKSRSGGTVKHYFPTKENDNLKIDSAVATICGLGRLITYENSNGAYESRTASGQDKVLRIL